MKKFLILGVFIFVGCSVSNLLFAQSNFDVAGYIQFLINNQNLETNELLTRFAPQNAYYNNNQTDFSSDNYCYLDSVTLLYQLTDGELQLLKTNRFFVTERLKYQCFGHAFHDIYANDLPVFISADAILHALHASYDRILMDVEIHLLEPQLITFLKALYLSYPNLLNKYQLNLNLADALSDVDLFVTVAYSLANATAPAPHLNSFNKVNEILTCIENEQMKSIPLFSERPRNIDFSQFTVRGHYNQSFWHNGGERTLGNYFKTMMWLGRIDFFLTAPPNNPWETPWLKEEIRRMNLGAFLLNELINLSQARELLQSNDEIITFLVGDSDNLTPDEFSHLINSLKLTSADQLLDDAQYDLFQNALINTANSGQKILSDFFLLDPFSTTPDTLPISYRLMGQRFIIDSYVFSNVVYDRIIFQNQKIWRPMPDPLDAMFVLGNNNAAPLLKAELDKYYYSSQLASLRYLVDAYDDSFWQATIYNCWLNSIRALNPQDDQTGYPYFMKTVAWQQEKLNSQLASWAQLRHDNLLYAKQSYTGGTACSFPHSFVEPYPNLYKNIATLANKALEIFSDETYTAPIFNAIRLYFTDLNTHMMKLEALAQKELNWELFTAEEHEFLHKMLFIEGGSGAPPFSGWYSQLFYLPEDAADFNFVIADVHTQPTDEFGNVVGRVLHVSVGKVNLGVFLADSPSNDYQPMCFVGPVMSYYEKITENFKRKTDEEWKEEVMANLVPPRPDWTNAYLADANGKTKPSGRQLAGDIYTDVSDKQPTSPHTFAITQNYPNPFNPSTTICYSTPQTDRVLISIYDVLGKKIDSLLNKIQSAGNHTIRWETENLSSGLYFCRIQSGRFDKTIKMMLVR